MRYSKIILWVLGGVVVLIVVKMFTRRTTQYSYPYGTATPPYYGNTGNSTVNSILNGLGGLGSIFTSIWNTTHQNKTPSQVTNDSFAGEPITEDTDDFEYWT